MSLLDKQTVAHLSAMNPSANGASPSGLLAPGGSRDQAIGLSPLASSIAEDDIVAAAAKWAWMQSRAVDLYVYPFEDYGISTRLSPNASAKPASEGDFDGGPNRTTARETRVIGVPPELQLLPEVDTSISANEPTASVFNPENITLPNSGLVFHNIYGAGVTAAYRTAIIAAENAFQNVYGDAVTLNMSFDLQSLGPNFSGQNSFQFVHVNYATLRDRLTARATSQDDTLAAASLPTADPSGGAGWDLPRGYAKLLGLYTANDDLDGIVLNSDLNFQFNQDAIGVLEHEISEGAMGRIGGLGVHNHAWTTMDLFRFTAAGQRDYTGGRDGISTFFGLDGAHVSTGYEYHSSIDALGNFDGFDLADWDHTVGDAFGPGGPGAPGTLSAVDLQVMDILGWTRGGAPPDDYPADANTNGTVAINRSATGNLERTGDHDWFRIQLVAGRKYTIDLQGNTVGAGTLTDPFLKLYNNASQLLVSDDDSGGNMNSRVVYTPNANDTFYVDAGAYNDQYTGTYRVSVTGPQLFQTPSLGFQGFGAAPGAGGWVSQDLYPRELADVNGDGRADIVGYGSAATYVSLAQGGGSFGPTMTGISGFGASPAGGGWSSQDLYPRQLADVNGDGKADIVGFGSAATYVSLATSGGQFAAPIIGIAGFGAAPSAGGWGSDDLYPRELADVNGDAKADIVAFGAAGVYVSLSTSGGLFAAPSLVLSGFGAVPSAGGWMSQNQYPRLLADVNGDHLADIIAFGASATFEALATGGGHFGPVQAALTDFGSIQGWTSQNTYPRLLGDVNHDGRADIVGMFSGGVHLALAAAGGGFGAATDDLPGFGTDPAAGGWSSQNLYPRVVGDVSGDGRADILGFGSGGAYVSLATNLFG